MVFVACLLFVSGQICGFDQHTWSLGTSGTIKSYNYDGGYHLANQQYNNCIRTEAGYCSISYAAVSDTTFQISLIAPAPGAAIAQIGDSCTQDWIVIPGGGSTVLASTNSDRSGTSINNMHINGPHMHNAHSWEKWYLGSVDHICPTLQLEPPVRQSRPRRCHLSLRSTLMTQSWTAVQPMNGV